MATKCFTSSSVKISKSSSILKMHNIAFIMGQNFYKINTITMMNNYDQSVEIKHNQIWSFILDHPYRILIAGGLGSGSNNAY